MINSGMIIEDTYTLKEYVIIAIHNKRVKLQSINKNSQRYIGIEKIGVGRQFRTTNQFAKKINNKYVR